MEVRRSSTSSSQSTHSSGDNHQPLLSPFAIRHGRRYLKNVPYPLPCDLPELQRQNLSTLLAVTALGKPICSPRVKDNSPKKVLEIACGSAYWSSLAHDYLASLGHTDVEFTGVDIVPMAADLNKQGIKWRFVQHDLRMMPLPFEDEEFDMVMCKDLGLVIPIGVPSQKALEEFIRVCTKGGIVEAWDVDSVIRSLMPHPPPPPRQNREDEEHAAHTATFLISPSTPFANCQNKFLQDASSWINEAVERRTLYTMPCSGILQLLLQETDTLADADCRRVAVPLGEMWWEREIDSEKRPMNRRDSQIGGNRRAGEDSILTEEQAALRYAALTFVIQLIESLEPLLKEVSGKNQEEWQSWWGWMMVDLLQLKGASSGECLELGAWWATKI
ncbi:Methyltransferase type 11 [Macrophomina phaseolina MS6]|uniref:Methyltransferase type 11 n=2 Tax=Macrophomina phaseolina TaxID=35725 RepID=K2QH50_MACPH|nr:Methyltransferase type 11 [Macrophomina phaseolina MS6]